jgi:hypothetical protein
MDNKAQMVVMESIIFSIMVVISLALLINLSLTSIQSSAQSTSDLKTLGDDALNAIYSTQVNFSTRGINPIDISNFLVNYNESISKLETCIVTNNYDELSSSLNAFLPNNIQYNIYIEDANGNREFWCNTLGDADATSILPTTETVFISHHMISIDPQHFEIYYPNLDEDIYGGGVVHESKIRQYFMDNVEYLGATYVVILEMWTI